MRITRRCFELIKVLTTHNTEVAVMCITPNDPTLIEEIYIPEQYATSATFEIEEEDYAKAAQELFDQGYEYHMFNRILLHTHPGNSATPSKTDWKNFEDLYSNKIFSSMIIVAKDFSSTCNTSVFLREINKKFMFSEKLEIYDPALEDDKNELMEELTVKIKQKSFPRNQFYRNTFESKNNSANLFDKGYYFDDFYGDSGIYAVGNCEVNPEVLKFYTGMDYNYSNEKIERLAARLGMILKGFDSLTLAYALVRLMEDSPIVDLAILNVARYLVLMGEIETVMNVETMKKTIEETRKNADTKNEAQLALRQDIK